MIVSEIGLNHLGDSDYADLYLENLINAKIDQETKNKINQIYYDAKKFNVHDREL